MKLFKRLWCLIVGHSYTLMEELDGHSILYISVDTDSKILKVDACKRCDALYARIERREN